MNKLKACFICSVLLTSFHGFSQKLSSKEKKIIKYVEKNNEKALDFLEKVVNVNSGTLNMKGVKKVGELFSSAFEQIDFKTTWIDMPLEMGRAGHLFAEIGSEDPKGKKLLLIGHLDTVFEEDSPLQEVRKEGNIMFGPGVNDMKGGDIIILYALKALREAGVLKDAQIIVAFTGDEEKAGEPLEISRKDLIEAAKRSDVALAFETATGLNYATVARRSSGSWKLEVTGKRAHSSSVFSKNTGAGAVFEMARILTDFYKELPEQFLTFNPGVVVGGTNVNFSAFNGKGDAFGKTNVVAQTVIVNGDMRCISEEQIKRTEAKMKAIVARHLPKTSAEITFKQNYPPMEPTEGNYEVLKVLDGVSKSLGQGEVKPYDPSKRGAGDISFVASYVDALDGLGTMGEDAHNLNESMEVEHFENLTKRAALLIYRLINTKNK